MSDWLVKDTDRGATREVESRSEAEEVADDLRGIVKQSGGDPDAIEIVAPDAAENSAVDATEPEVMADGAEAVEADNVDTTQSDADADGISELVTNPIDWLQSKNSAYVNNVKGTDAISKRGFRYIQSRFNISTESDVVEFVDDPVGVIVWARAELPDGRCAEAHGEGWQFETKVDDNEFVRYADSRAKSRALSDLTAGGALATSELSGEE